MEDVQQRRQRLAAMREQADLEDGSDAEAYKTVPAAVPGSSLSLPNPMMDAPPVTEAGANRASGFDFFTDPLTAFTGAKRRKPAVGGVLGGAPSFGPGVVQGRQWQSAPRPPPVFLHPSMHPPPPPLLGHGWQPTPYQPPLAAPGPPPSYNLGQPRSFSNQSHGRGMEMGSGGRRGRGMFSPAGGRCAYANDYSGQGRGYSNNNRWNSGGETSGGVGFVARGGLTRASQGRGGQRGGRTPSAKDQCVTEIQSTGGDYGEKLIKTNDFFPHSARLY